MTKNYRDVACTCGHVPQSEKHLCDLETTSVPEYTTGYTQEVGKLKNDF